MADQRGLTPEEAVERLERDHAAACKALREALARYVTNRAIPTADERVAFRYPELRLNWQSGKPVPFTRRAWAKFQAPGLYATTVTQPAFFRGYLLEQLRPLVDEFGAHIDVGVSDQEIPYPFVTEAGDEFVHGGLSVADLARYFPTPLLSNVGDEIADGLWRFEVGRPRPLALFDAVRVDFSVAPPRSLYRH